MQGLQHVARGMIFGIAVAKELNIRIAIVGDPKNHSTRDMLQALHKAPHA